MTRFKLGIVLETTGLPPRPALEAVAKLCVRGVQISAAGDLAPDRLGETGRREFRTLLKSSDLELAAVNVPLRRGLDTTEDQQPRLDHIRKAMLFAYELGARKVVVPFPRLPAEAETARAATLKESLLALAAYADKTGSDVCLEAGLDAGDKVRDYLAGYAGGLLVNFDPANFLANGHDPLTSLAALAGKVGHTHARDVRAATVSGGPKEVPVGAGDIEWLVYVATLESIAYHGYLTVDREDGATRFADAAAGVKFLRRFVGPA